MVRGDGHERIEVVHPLAKFRKIINEGTKRTVRSRRGWSRLIPFGEWVTHTPQPPNHPPPPTLGGETLHYS